MRINRSHVLWTTLIVLFGMCFPAMLALASFFEKPKSYGDRVSYRLSALLHDYDKIPAAVSEAFYSNSRWPAEIEMNNKRYQVNYTFNSTVSDYIKKQLSKYRPDFASVVLIDNDSGKVLSAIGYDRFSNRFDDRIPFSATHPAASLFKVITTAELLESGRLNEDSTLNYRGRSTTLYKYQLQEKKDRWTRVQSLAEAFARSNNVIFGKAAINYLTGDDLVNMAERFGFNQELPADIRLPRSRVEIPQDDYEMACVASGFNRETMISPVHAAILSSIVANDGVMKTIRVIDSAQKAGEADIVWQSVDSEKTVIDDRKVLDELRDMMERTVQRGTGKRGFKRMKSAIKFDLDIGGKSGSITGGVPYGKRDWFSAFAIPKDGQFGRGVSISVMLVNVNKWHVRSSLLAKDIIEYYFGTVAPLNNAK